MTAPSVPPRSIRDLLRTSAAPLTPHGLVSALSAKAASDFGVLEIQLQYTPDRAVLGADAFQAYAGAMAETGAQTPEALAAAISNDIANELVPKWHRVTVRIGAPPSHEVVIDDRQPGAGAPAWLKGI